MSNSGVSGTPRLPPEVVKGYQWDNNGGYREQTVNNMTLFGAGAAIFSTTEDLYLFDLALYGDSLLTTRSQEFLLNGGRPYSWDIGTMPLAPSGEVNFQTYSGQIEGYSSMMTRFIDDRHSIIILSNIGMSHFLKQQLTSDIASILYDQNIPDRKKDASLALTTGIVSGEFEKALDSLNSNNFELNEQSMTAIAYQLLWSGLANQSLKLFSLIRDKFKDSSAAKENLLRACDHRLTKSVIVDKNICKNVR